MIESSGLAYQSKSYTAIQFRHHYVGAIRIGLFAAVIFSLANEYYGFDRKFADFIYLAGNHSWVLQKNFWLQKIIHNGGRDLSVVLAILVFIVYCSSFYFEHLFQYRKILLYLFLSVTISTGLVSIGKHLLGLSCPWEFSIYGGNLEYLSRFSQLWIGNGKGCFPAGHSSAGYSWMSLFFVGIYLKSAWRWYGLFIPLIVGLIFGFAQQLRGAHFLSDDIWTLTICWISATLLYRVMLAADASTKNSVIVKKQ